MNTRKLQQQLAKNGASKKDAQDLTTIAKQIGTIKTRGLSEKTRKLITEIPAIDSKKEKRPSVFWITSSLATATAVFAFVFVGQSLLTTQNPQSASDVQTHETEKQEIEKMIEQSKTELEELQKAELPVEEAEEKYDEALDRLNKWESRQKENSDQESRSRIRWRDRREDVRGSWDSKEDNEQSEEENSWRYRDRRFNR